MGKSEKDEAPSSTETKDDLLPVSLLCGFLGAGKTTMLKHILETKHEDQNFKCAVIVNDMAALNIDKSLIDQSGLVQSDEVISMENGCFCCTLQSDLVDQIISLTKQRKFNYMLIEASGVSEPSQIAPLFDLHEHDPDDPETADHEHGPDNPQLGEVARLDTCVTVVDSAEFYNNLESMKTYEQGDIVGTIAELMMEQVEFSNVVVINKADLVSEEQQSDIIDKIVLINPKAWILKTVHSKINVKDILNTRLFEASKEEEDFFVTASKEAAEEKEKIEAEMLDCCQKSLTNQGKKCCKSKKDKFLDSGLSQVQLEVVKGNLPITRHEKRFGITSFIYLSRRPFHPGRLASRVLEPYWMDDLDEPEEETEEEKEVRLKALQKKAAEKQKRRKECMGDLLRSKGFIWIATSQAVMGGWQQAGNVIRIEGETYWMCEQKELWEDQPEVAKLVYKDMKKLNGEEWLYGDRRQEMVFIGQGLKHEFIQKCLDECLLTDEEMEMGPEKWKEAFEDPIQMQGPDEGEEEDEESDEDENADGEEDDVSQGSKSSATSPKRKKLE